MPLQGLTVAAVADAFGHDVDACFETVERRLAEARGRGARLVVFPECALGGYIREPMPDEMGPVLPPSLAPDGPEIARLIRMAGDVVVCIGYSEPGPHGPYSTAICVSGDGIHGVQRKVHLPPAERFAYTPGDSFAAFDTPVGRLGMLLCYDKLFPEASRTLVLDGAEAVACLAAWPVDRHHPARRIADDRQARHFDVLDVARAIENQVVWIAANQTGQHGPLRFLGHAKVVDPDGVVLARTSHRSAVAVAEVARDEALDWRATIDHLADRRPIAYGPPGEAGAMEPAFSG